MLEEEGREASPEAIEHLMADALTIAFRDLARKPARWSLSGWLAWIARRELRREARGEALTQSSAPAAQSPVHT